MTFNVKLVSKIKNMDSFSKSGGICLKNKLIKDMYEILKNSRSVFIDLAGSEKQVYNKNELLAEGCFINKSLSILNHVITSLSNGKTKDFIHYRDSK
jgi:hypothetical protein